jgi:chromosome partitioning protein
LYIRTQSEDNTAEIWRLYASAKETEMILAVANTKGGVGKTTLAVNLAVARSRAGRDVLLVDGDEQGTAMAFTELRAAQLGEIGYTAVALQGAALRTQVRQIAPRYGDVIIDVGGRDTGSLRAALTVADVVLIPVQPRSYDIWAIDQMGALVTEAREVHELRAVTVLNAADSQGKDNEEAAAALRQVEGLEHCPAIIVRRKAFPNAGSAGRSVLEYEDSKASAELNELITFVYTTDVQEIDNAYRAKS